MTRTKIPSTRATSRSFKPIKSAEDFQAVFDVSRETLKRLQLYADLLRQWQSKINLVAPRTLDEIWQRHFADSAQLIDVAPTLSGRWIDIGSGGGFPGMIMAILLADARFCENVSRETSPEQPRSGAANGDKKTPEQPRSGVATGGKESKAPSVGSEAGKTEPAAQVTLVESDSRKAAFLSEVSRRTKIPVDILNARIELSTTQAKVGQADIYSARAFAPFDRLLRDIYPMFSASSVGLFLKGRTVADEIETAKRMWKFDVQLVKSVTDPDGRIVIVRNLMPKTEG